jgi:prolyl-tRNA editing enzyme YbaK/EbsC (Cys-tRNA(Pro) deacylase)
MKTVLPLYVDEDVMKWDTIYLSGGRIGLTIEIDPKTLLEELGAKTGVFTR